ncbi:MAG: TonB-dependent siderophore receptor, partial [Sphingobium sp.]
LSRMLAGTGLTFRFIRANVVTLEPIPQTAGGDGAIQLGPVRVEGEGGGTAGAGIAPSVTSDPNATENTGSFTTRIMSSATRLPLTIRETPQAVTVLTNARIEQDNLIDLVDAVKAVPGLYIGSGELRPTFYSRGYEIEKILQDGIPRFNDWYIADTLGNLAMQDRVEVVRGATGLMQGSGNPSGAISMIRKRPTRDVRIKGMVGLGSWEDYRAMADVGGPLTADGGIRARVVGYFQDAEGFRDIEYKKNQMFYATVDFDIGPATTLNLGYSYIYSNRNTGLWGGLPVTAQFTHLDTPRSTNTATDWEFSKNAAHNIYASLVHDFGHGWSLNVNGTYVHSKTDHLATFVVPTPDVGGYGHVWWAGYKSRKQKAIDINISGKPEIFGIEHDIVFGGTYNDVTGDTTEYWDSWDNPLTAGVDLATWNHSAPRPDTSNPAFRFLYEDIEKDRSLYASGRFNFSDAVHLILGGRLDWMDRTFAMWGNSFKARAVLTKYAGLTWDFVENHSVYASYTDIFQPQDAYDVDQNLLPPKTGGNYEVGVKGAYFDGALNASAVVFLTDEKDLAIYMADQSACPTYPARGCFSAAGLVRTKGIDIELQGALTPDWQIGAGITWSTTRFRKDLNPDNIGKRFGTNSPTTLIKLSTQYTLPGTLNRLQIGGRLHWQSKMYGEATNIDGLVVRNQQDARVVMDLSATYKVTENIKIQLDLNNIFDKKYYTSIADYDYFWGAYESFGAPRNFLVTVRADF